MLENIWGFIIAFLQGLLEWIPVSSSGFITLANTLLGTPVEESFKIALTLHLGSGVAAFTIFKKDFMYLIKELKNLLVYRDLSKSSRDIVIPYLACIIVSLLTGFTIYALLLKYLEGMSFEYILIFIGALLLFTGFIDTYVVQSRKISPTKGSLSFTNWLLLGLVQGLAVVPGLSRSGLVLAYLSLIRISPRNAFRINLLIGAPVLVLAGLYNLLHISVDAYILVLLFIAFISSYVFGRIYYSLFSRINVTYFVLMVAVLLIISGVVDLIT